MRNSEQSVVQFSYGDDGLNPNVMEKGDRPVDFARLKTNTFLKYIINENESVAAAASLGEHFFCFILLICC